MFKLIPLLPRINFLTKVFEIITLSIPITTFESVFCGLVCIGISLAQMRPCSDMGEHGGYCSTAVEQPLSEHRSTKLKIEIHCPGSRFVIWTQSMNQVNTDLIIPFSVSVCYQRYSAWWNDKPTRKSWWPFHAFAFFPYKPWATLFTQIGNKTFAIPVFYQF